MFFLSQAFARRLLGARSAIRALFHSIVNVTSSNAVAVAVPARGILRLEGGGGDGVEGVRGAAGAGEHRRL